MGTKTPTYLEKLKAERDELAAELERVKAERDKWFDTLISERIQHRDLLRKIDNLKSRLPVNADGDVVLPDSEQWVWGINRKPEKQTVRGFDKNQDGEWLFYLCKDYETFTCTGAKRADNCHSTAESCRAAHEKGE